MVGQAEQVRLPAWVTAAVDTDDPWRAHAGIRLALYVRRLRRRTVGRRLHHRRIYRPGTRHIPRRLLCHPTRKPRRRAELRHTAHPPARVRLRRLVRRTRVWPEAARQRCGRSAPLTAAEYAAARRGGWTGHGCRRSRRTGLAAEPLRRFDPPLRGDWPKHRSPRRISPGCPPIMRGAEAGGLAGRLGQSGQQQGHEEQAAHQAGWANEALESIGDCATAWKPHEPVYDGSQSIYTHKFDCQPQYVVDNP